MQGYLIRRVLLIIPTLFVVTILIFSIMRLLPGDAALVILAGNSTQGSVDTKRYQEVRHELGLDESYVKQYTKWLWGIAHLDLGKSLNSGESISSEIARTIPVTVELALLSTIIGLMVAIPIGAISAVYQDSPWDYLLRIFGLSGMAMPVFWTGSMMILLLVIFFRWLPPVEWASLFKDPVTNLKQIILPSIALAHFQAALLSRMTRSSLLEVMRQDYVRTARAKGLGSRIVLQRHALRNALLPVITFAGLQFGSLLGGAVIVESIFVLPGVGFLLLHAVLNRDWVMIQALVTLLALSFMLVNLLVDLLYAWLDPRIRYST